MYIWKCEAAQIAKVSHSPQISRKQPKTLQNWCTLYFKPPPYQHYPAKSNALCWKYVGRCHLKRHVGKSTFFSKYEHISAALKDMSFIMDTVSGIGAHTGSHKRARKLSKGALLWLSGGHSIKTRSLGLVDASFVRTKPKRAVQGKVYTRNSPCPL